MSAFGWVIYSKNLFSLILCNFRHYYCFVRPVIVVFGLCRLSFLLSFPLVPSHLFAPAHSCCLQTHHFTFSSSFCLAALRNQLFCIYFIAIWPFLIYFPLFFFTPSSFYRFLSIWGLLLKISPLYDVYFRFKLEQIFSFFFGGGGGVICVGRKGWMVDYGSSWGAVMKATTRTQQT